MLSVIVPSDCEPETPFFEKNLQELRAYRNCEVIVVALDEAPTRAERLNIGFVRAKGSMILFHHPRSRIDPAGIVYLIENAEREFWGGFTHRFDHPHALLTFTSFYSNRVRSRMQRIIYLDHCIFFHRSLWREKLPPIEIFEDTLLCHNLRRVLSPVVLPYLSTTSAIRFRRNGIFRQSILNQIMKMAFYLNLPHAKLNRLYERGLSLNSKRNR